MYQPPNARRSSFGGMLEFEGLLFFSCSPMKSGCGFGCGSPLAPNTTGEDLPIVWLSGTPTHIRPESRHSLKHTYAHTHTNRWHRDTDQPQQQQQDAAEFEIRSTGLAVCSGGPVTRAYAVVFAYDLGCHHQGSGVAEGAVE